VKGKINREAERDLNEGLNPSDPPMLWNPNAAGLWSLLFTPTFGSYLLMRNWRAIGDTRRAIIARRWMIVSAVLIAPSVIFGAIALIYLIVWYFLEQRPQYSYVMQSWGPEYPRRSWKGVLAIAFGLWATLWAFVVLGLYLISRAV